MPYCLSSFFFFTVTSPSYFYTLSLHDALPISHDFINYGNVFFQMSSLEGRCTFLIGRTRHADKECAAPFQGARSEEHTSELQSLTNLVCRLLLEKKKKKKKTNTIKQKQKSVPM